MPSEKAFAYKMKLEAIKRCAGRPIENCGQVVHNKSRDEIAKGAEESGRQIQALRRFTLPAPWNILLSIPLAYTPLTS
ncbi:hypothetical protein FACS1894120_5460 [Clostridia bacterium]|nr:hypothetical protein FACS1894120_5460 [Clostridia bacterium]